MSDDIRVGDDGDKAYVAAMRQEIDQAFQRIAKLHSLLERVCHWRPITDEQKDGVLRMCWFESGAFSYWSEACYLNAAWVHIDHRECVTPPTHWLDFKPPTNDTTKE